tara:strand:- start:6190 stop:6327 length:138 start_codon:yes stop_codon:yes gene_type:complete
MLLSEEVVGVLFWRTGNPPPETWQRWLIGIGAQPPRAFDQNGMDE